MSGNMENQQLPPPYDQLPQSLPPSYDQIIQLLPPQYNQISQILPPQYDQITLTLPPQYNETTQPSSQDNELSSADDLSSISITSTTVSTPTNASNHGSCESLGEYSGHYTRIMWPPNAPAHMQAPRWVTNERLRNLENPDFRNDLISVNETEESCAMRWFINCLAAGCTLFAFIVGPLCVYLYQILKKHFFT